MNAEITPKVQGYLLKQDYQNGYFVKKGQLLFELDPRQYQAAARARQGGRGGGTGQAAREYTADVQRDTPLAAQNAIPQKQLDTDLANQAATKAEVRAAEGRFDECGIEPGLDQGLFPHRRHRGRIQLADR